MPDNGARHGWLTRHLPAVVLPLLAAAFFARRGRPVAAVAVLVFGAVMLALRVASGGRVDAAIARAAAAVGHAFTAAALALFQTFVVIPAWAVGRVIRRPSIRVGQGFRPQADERAGPRRPFSADVPVERGALRRATSASLLAIGAVTVLLAMDLAVGVAWGRIRPEDEPGPTGAGLNGVDGTRLALLEPGEGALQGTPSVDPSVQAQRSMETEFWPVLTFRTRPVTSGPVRTDGWIRRSHQVEAPGPLPRVLLFGGSVVFGTGQRDTHTIASEVVRLAAADGVPVRVENHGQPGWTVWQSWIRLEQVTAHADPPAVAVVVNGSEELRAVRPEAGTVSHVAFVPVRDRMEGNVEVIDRTLADVHREKSAVRRLLRTVVGDEPAGADPRPDDARVPTAAEAAETYRRGRDVVLDLAVERDFDTLLAWQPLPEDDSAGRAAADAVGEPTVDLTNLLQGEGDVFLPDGSVNEAGARLIAEELWARIKPSIDRWYVESD